jgi:osmotically-inducible protein OsmY
MIKIFGLFALIISLSSCGPEILFFGSAGGGAVLAKEKTIGNTVDDSTIWSKIKADFLNHHKKIEGIMTNVSVEVSEGRVLLTGTVHNSEERLKIVKIVWSQNGVREVMNEIKLSGEQSPSYGTDTWITMQVKSKLLSNKEVHSMNYNVETIDNIVYILGIAKNETEKEKVISLAESVKKVNKVVDYIRVKYNTSDSPNNSSNYSQQQIHQETVEDNIPAREQEKTPHKQQNQEYINDEYAGQEDHIIEISDEQE